MNAAQSVTRSKLLLHVCLLHLLLSLTVAASSQDSPSQCAPRYIANLTHSLCPLEAGPEPSQPVFPTDNEARSAGGRELHMLLASNDQGNSAKQKRKGALVVLFYLAGDPPSVAITPVFRCLPAFFNEEVQFVSVAYSELSLMALMSQGLHALPVLQVNAQGRRYRYSGKHRLRPMLHWVARALAQEPVVGLDVAQFCSSQQQRPPDPSDGPPHTCRPHSSLAYAYAASRGAAGGAPGRCDRHSMCRREWECDRWDGEVTLEELRAQQPAPLFYISLAFLVLRVMWLAHKWLTQRSSRRAAAIVAPDAPTQAAPAPAAQAGLGAAEPLR